MARRIAILGASANRSKFGNKAIRAYASAGWDVLLINPRETEIEGLPVFRALADIDGPIDRVNVYLPPRVTRELLPEIAATGAADTFFNPGSANEEILQEATALGIGVRDACSIVAIGLSPTHFP